jgi:hypothetical protein
VEIFTPWGLVAAFSFPGGAVGNTTHSAFTTLDMFIHPHTYYARVGQHYHDRWLRRLANAFARECAGNV